MRNEKILLRCGTSINIPHPESYKDCLLLIKSDNYRVVGKYEPTKTIVMKNLRHLGDSVLFWFRLCQYRGLFFRFFCSVFYVISKRANIYIPPLTRIGYGIELGHKMSIVINGGTIIGNNVSLSHFVSIGTNHDTPAIIGDNVYMGKYVYSRKRSDWKWCNNWSWRCGNKGYTKQCYSRRLSSKSNKL